MSDSDPLAGLPTALPQGLRPVPGLPGAVTSPSISSKIDAAVASFKPGVNGIKGNLSFVEHDGEITVKAMAAVKISDGWALYSDAAWDLHSGDKEAGFGIEGDW